MTRIESKLREAVSAYLKRTGRTRIDLAASVGVHRSSLSEWLSGRRRMPERYWSPLAEQVGAEIVATVRVRRNRQP